MAIQIQTTSYNLIYIFSRDEIKDALKIGKASVDAYDVESLTPNCEALNLAAKHRINEETQTAAVAYHLLHTEVAWFKGADNKQYSFMDKDVHDLLLRSGYEQKKFPGLEAQPTEWFKVDLDTATKAIKAVKEGKDTIDGPIIETKPKKEIRFRDEQKDAIRLTIEHFKVGKRMLWNAKMRFGKTLCALELIRQEQFNRVLILTHRPVVRDGWFKDYHNLDFTGYQYGSRNGKDTNQCREGDESGRDFATLEKNFKEKGTKYIYFASMQDLRGSKDAAIVEGKGIDKNDAVFKTDWDLILLDEAHEGTQTPLGKNVIAALCQGRDPFMLYLSGTPYNILSQFSEEEIYTWDYVMEQRAKRDWDQHHPDEPNPYEGLAKLNIYTYNIGDVFKNTNYTKTDEDFFNFAEFFRVWTGNAEVDGEELPEGASVGDFVHRKDVWRFLNLLCEESENSEYPYSKESFRQGLSHTLWMLPRSVASAKALEKMLNEHPLHTEMGFEIVNVAGNGDKIEDLDPDDAAKIEKQEKDALKKVNAAIDNYSRTITLSCGRLTTGVSVWQWTGVFMLSGGYQTKAAGYMQTIFRGQTPYKNGAIKKNCYAFDFAPDRTLTVIDDYLNVQPSSANHHHGHGDHATIVDEFLQFCAVISMRGSQERSYDAESFITDANRAYADNVIRQGFKGRGLVRNYAEFTEDDYQLLEEVGKLLSGGKVRTGSDGTLIMSSTGLTGEGAKKKKKNTKKKSTEKTKTAKTLQKELQDRRKKAQDVLDQIFIRLPLLLFGSVENIEGLTLDDLLDENVIDQPSWEEFMPDNFTKPIMKQLEHLLRIDVLFSSANKIIKEAKAADELPVEDRVKAIANMLSRFHYPDRETVLTPWRVVNMHMSETIGGYDFYEDEDHHHIAAEPKWVDRGEVTRQVICNPQTHILEVNSKSGVYPLYITYSLYRKQLEQVDDANSNESKQKVWDQVLNNNVFVLCKTTMAKKITQRVLTGYSDKTAHCKYYPRLVEILRAGEGSKRYKTLTKKLLSSNFWDMSKDKDFKFDAVLGNPPYNIMDGGNSASAMPIYQEFVRLSKNLQPDYISLIMQSRWFAGGRNLDNFRKEMLEDSHIKYLADYPNGKECFPNTFIAGGICYFLRDANYDGPCLVRNVFKNKITETTRRLNEHDVFIRLNEALPIIDKVQQANERNMVSFVSPQRPYGFRTYYRGSKNRGDNDIVLISSEGRSFVSRDKVTSLKENIDKYKVMVSRADSGHPIEEVSQGKLANVICRGDIMKPGEVCTETWLSIGAFETEEEAKNLLSYLETRFVRFLLLQSLTSIMVTDTMFSFVPIQDFSRAWTDADLYKKYGLTEEEINFIESTIKPME